MEDGNTVVRACEAIEKLAFNHPDNMQQFDSIGLCDVIPRTLIRNSSNPEAFESLCRLIGVLALNVSMRAKFGVTGSLDIISKGLKQLLHVEGVAEQSCYALNKLLYENHDNVWKLGEVGVCPMIIGCLQHHPHNSTVVVEGMKAIIHLATFEDNRTHLTAPGIAEVLVNSASRHFDEPQVSYQLIYHHSDLNTEFIPLAFNVDHYFI